MGVRVKKIRLNKLIRIILSIIVIIVLVRQIMLKDWFMVFSCLYTLITFSIPTIFDKKFKIKFPFVLEIAIYLFVFAAEIIGEVGAYYITVSWWDDLLHTTSGMLLTSVGLFLISLLGKKNKKLYLPTFYKVLTAFCFSATILVLWECFEFGMDNFFGTDMQKDTIITTINSVNLNKKRLNSSVELKVTSLEVNDEDWIKEYNGYIDIGLYDTMYDLLDGLMGTLLYSIFSYLYLNKKQKIVL